MTFRAGQRVVCVEDRPWWWYMPVLPCVRPPRRGEVFTVSRVFMGPPRYPFLHLDFVERPHPGNFWWGPGYFAHWFRPVVEKRRSAETGMGILRGLLKGEPVGEDA